MPHYLWYHTEATYMLGNWNLSHFNKIFIVWTDVAYFIFKLIDLSGTDV